MSRPVTTEPQRPARHVHTLYPPPARLPLGPNPHTLEERDEEPCVVVQLTQQVRALVDPNDWLYLAAYRWVAALHGARLKRWVMIARARGNKLVLAHRLVAIEAGMVPASPNTVLVDHAYHAELEARVVDNRRSNLRPATGSENGANTRPRTLAAASSRFRGVCWHFDTGRWCAKCGGQWLGSFDDECDAARAYDAAARELYGEFARLNFPLASAPLPI